MEKTIKAKFKKGIIEPLEKLELEEGSEISITIRDLSQENRFARSAGSWRDLVDCEELLKDISKSRKITGPEVEL